MWKFLLILAAVLYSLSPYDLLPDFIVGWGWLDDLVVIAILWRLFNRIKQKTSPFQNTKTAGRQNDRREEYESSRQRSPSLDPYTVLGVNQNATADDIKHAYRLLAGQYHPDKVSHLGEEFRQLAEKRFKEIQEAYQYLTKRKGM